MEESPSAEPGVDGPAAKGTTEYKTMPIEDALRALGSVVEGLDEAEVEKRLKTYGRNESRRQEEEPDHRVLVPVLRANAVAAGAGDRSLCFSWT